MAKSSGEAEKRMVADNGDWESLRRPVSCANIASSMFLGREGDAEQ